MQHLARAGSLAGGRLVVQLASRPGVKDEDQFDAVAEAVYSRGNCLLVIDDAMGALTVRPPYYVRRVWGMGRSRGVGAMALVTMAHNIPRDFLTQAEHVVAFELHNADDADRLRREAAAELAEALELRRWEYIWYDRAQRLARRFRPLSRAGDVAALAPARIEVAPNLTAGDSAAGTVPRGGR